VTPLLWHHSLGPFNDCGDQLVDSLVLVALPSQFDDSSNNGVCVLAAHEQLEVSLRVKALAVYTEGPVGITWTATD